VAVLCEGGGGHFDLHCFQVKKFADAGKLKVIGPFLPLGDHRLPVESYEMVLMEYLKTDHKVSFSVLAPDSLNYRKTQP